MSSFRDRVDKNRKSESQHSTEKHEPIEKSNFFGIANADSYPTTLDLRLKDGKSKAVPYSYIQEINFDPSEGIEIILTQKKVLITGRNLEKLYNYLAAYRVKYIQANIGNDMEDGEEKDLFVKEISIDEV